MKYRYRLATYRECKAHREWNTTCPNCGRKDKFSPYIDIATMQPVDDKCCGRCNRLSNCGYHLPPRMMASPNFARKRDSLVPINRQSSQPTLFRVGPKRGLAESAMSAAPSLRGSAVGEAAFYEKMRRACEQSQLWGSHLVTWLRTRFPREQVDAALKRYHVGGTPDGATLWWQIDEQGRVHTGKAMQYNPLTGHRVKEGTPSVLRTSPPLWGEGSAMAAKPLHRGRGWGGSSPVNWAHRMRIYGEPSELVVPQCLFGEHLASHPDSSQARLLGADKSAVVANDAPFRVVSQGEGAGSAMQDSPPWEGLGEAPLCLVESEKTALIMSLVCPDQVWLATGGKANFKEQMLAPLIGLEVAVYPDADALHDWYARAVEMNRRLGTRLYIPTWYYNMMDHPEAIARGLDLADMLLDNQSSSVT